MDMHKDNCDRCNQPTNNATIMSMFNTDTICMKCKDEEKKHPDYDKAVKADHEAIRNRNYNFKGIGYEPLKSEVK